jgi:hypothetical protein
MARWGQIVDNRRMIRWALVLIFAGLGVAEAGMAGPALGVFSAIATQHYGATAQVLEIRGERGAPQPTEWVARLSDPGARGGVREITLEGGKITSERTPLYLSSEVAGLLPIARSKVTVDSDEVFRIANREAVKNEVGFHWIEYVLRTDPSDGAPVWNVRLFDNMGALMGTLKISAQGGTVLRGFVPTNVVRTSAGREE